MPDTNPPPINASRLKLRQLLLVLRLHETRNLNKAAATLNISQPAATRLLKETEQILNATLYERSSKGMVPTPYGEATARYAKLLLTGVQKLHKELDGLKRGIEGQVRIGAVMASVPAIVTDTICSIQADYPNVVFTLVTEGSHTLLSALLDNRLDFVVGRIVGTYPPEQFSFESWFNEDLSIVVGRHHRLLRRARLSMADLSAASWILEPHPSPSRKVVEQSFDRVGLARPACSVETVSMIGTTNLIHNTNLVSVMPTLVARYYAELLALAILPISLQSDSSRVGLITVPGRELSPAVAFAIATLRRCALGQTFDPELDYDPGIILES